LQEAERAEKAIKEAIAHLKEVVKSKEPPPPNLDFQVSFPMLACNIYVKHLNDCYHFASLEFIRIL
jgi:hypothetical protein